MKNHCDVKRFGKSAWRLNISIKGETLADVDLALEGVTQLLRNGQRSGAHSGDHQAYIFKLREAAQ